ncbi:MAG: DNA double-strand break repair nuclease NurA [Chloroflexi bacterium]|nr:DNA double-strand break repair nuclease NurA [Chloroflexota bacterium]
MSLDLEQVASPVQKLAQHAKTREMEARRQRERAVENASSLGPAEIDSLRARIENSRGKVRWPAAGLTDAICRRYPLPERPASFSVLAVDGSHIENDRNRVVQCYLINLGQVRLDYGEKPGASLSSRAVLRWDKDLVMESPKANEEEEPVEGAVLGAHRSAEECQLLASMVEELPGSQPVLALLDGSLVLFGVTSLRPFVREELIDRGLIPALDRIRAIATSRPAALASYISLPRSTDVVNALRISLCKHETPDCSKHCFSKESSSD